MSASSLLCEFSRRRRKIENSLPLWLARPYMGSTHLLPGRQLKPKALPFSPSYHGLRNSRCTGGPGRPGPSYTLGHK